METLLCGSHTFWFLYSAGLELGCREGEGGTERRMVDGEAQGLGGHTWEGTSPQGAQRGEAGACGCEEEPLPHSAQCLGLTRGFWSP